MWSSAKARLIAGLALSLACGACGFRPLYGESGRTAAVQTDLGDVQVDPIPDRLGQRLRQDLVDRINPKGEPALGRYHLAVKLAEAQDGEGIRSDLTFARVNYRLFAEWQLRDEKNGSVIAKGTSRAFTSYNVGANPFATVTAENDGRERAANEVAEDIRMRLAVYFESNGTVK